jgi:predicted solute-binding protein
MNDNIAQLDREIESAEEAIKLGQSFERLKQNADFKNIITEGYFKDYASNLVYHLDFPQEPGLKEEAEKAIKGISALAVFFHKIQANADMAMQNREQALQTRELMMQEEV